MAGYAKKKKTLRNELVIDVFAILSLQIKLVSVFRFGLPKFILKSNSLVLHKGLDIIEIIGLIVFACYYQTLYTITRRVFRLRYFYCLHTL